MIHAIFTFFIFSFLLRRWLRPKAYGVWVGVSLLALAQVSQPTLLAVFALLGIHEIVFLIHRRWRLDGRFFPLIYAASLIALHHILHLNISGFSYLVLASSLDLWLRMRGEPVLFKERFLSLISFTKSLVGPIASAQEHRPADIDLAKVACLAIFGIVKGFILVNLWRTYLPMPLWENLFAPTDYLAFGLWNYVHLYLEFSGICDLVAATFWLYGFGCPLNFDRPYFASTITDFWKRWHITLGAWIKNFVFIPLGGSRVSQPFIYLNLLVAMTLSGAWHGVGINFISWGLLQGVFLCVERAIGLVDRLKTASKLVRFVSWLITQTLVTLSWILFFAKF